MSKGNQRREAAKKAAATVRKEEAPKKSWVSEIRGNRQQRLAHPAAPKK